jgi:hemoglobin-like flavoprotein
VSDPVAESLALLAARVGDPAALVYARLFARHPELEALFVMDRGGQVRGQMLAMVLEALLDGGARLGGLIGIERMNHSGYGVPEDAFDGFYALLMETVRDALGPDWTPAMERGWRERIATITGAEESRAPCRQAMAGP